MVLGQEKGKDTDARLKHNFGMMYPEGFRKARRLMRMAEKFSLPVITFLDTPGAYAGLEAEERGQGMAIAENLFEMAELKTPILVVIIGEGCSGGALGVGVGDVVGMLEHAYFSVISPESCASILWKDAKKKEEAAYALKLHAEDLMQYHLIDTMIPEPFGGAHRDPPYVYMGVKKFLIENLSHLKAFSPEALVERRYQKYRKMGRFRA